MSPEASGGAGTIEEYTLGAVALARLLTGDLLPGLATAPTSIAMQRRVAGNTLNDLVARSRTVAAEPEIDFQIKQTAPYQGTGLLIPHRRKAGQPGCFLAGKLVK